MKYCPYCGAELVNGTVSFCAECGKKINVCRQTENDTPPETVDEKENAVVDSIEKNEAHNSDYEYDGYYEDIVPDDAGTVGQAPDKVLIKKIVLLIVTSLIIIGVSILVMYLL